MAAFTSGHAEFRQSLLARREDSRRIAEIGSLSVADVVSLQRGTAGEERPLRRVAVTDGHGVLKAGTRIVTPTDTLTLDGSAAYSIAAAMASPALGVRQHLVPLRHFPRLCSTPA